MSIFSLKKKTRPCVLIFQQPLAQEFPSGLISLCSLFYLMPAPEPTTANTYYAANIHSLPLSPLPALSRTTYMPASGGRWAQIHDRLRRQQVAKKEKKNFNNKIQKFRVRRIQKKAGGKSKKLKNQNTRSRQGHIWEREYKKRKSSAA